MLEMSEDNIRQLREEAGMIDGETLMRYIRIFSELSNQLRYASQKRVLIELALIKLTKPQMEPNLDSILQRLNELEDRLDEGIALQPEMMQQLAQMQAGAGAAPSLAASPGMGTGAPGGAYGGDPAQPGDPAAAGGDPEGAVGGSESDPQRMGEDHPGSGRTIRPSFRDTVVEPSGESCLCIVFSGQDNYAIGSRPTVLGELEHYIEEKYGKTLYLKTRVKNAGERLNTIYVSDEELKEAIHMDITIED